MKTVGVYISFYINSGDCDGKRRNINHEKRKERKGFQSGVKQDGTRRKNP